MIPYFELPPLQVGPITLHPFGILAGLGTIAGLVYGRAIAQRDFSGGSVFLDMASWVLIPGLVLSHVAAVVSSYPAAGVEPTLWSYLDMRQGMSAFGGLFGGTLGAWLFTRRHRLPLLPWLDVFSRGFALAFIFGRLGCSIAHDHPGLPSDFFLAMDYPARDGYPPGPRHDLGFYELLFWMAFFPLLHWLGRRRRPDGLIFGLLILVYCPFRFAFDFLRTNDTIYAGLTFSQWIALLVLPVGIWLLRRAIVAPEKADPLATAAPPQKGRRR